MKNPAKIDYEVRWLINPDMTRTDPLSKKLREVGNFLPYRVYLQPVNELLCEGEFNIFNQTYSHETHYLSLDTGTYWVELEDLTGWLKLEITNPRLNGVRLPSMRFSFN